MKSLITQLLNRRIVRYGLVGGIGILINELALFVFSYMQHNLQLIIQISVMSYHKPVDLHYALASACAFEVSTTINFVMNQLFTYHEQKIHGWDWIWRAGKAQLTSLSALLLSFTIGLVCVYGFNVNQYIAEFVGIVIAFGYNFSISQKFVFQPMTSFLAGLEKEVEIQA